MKGNQLKLGQCDACRQRTIVAEIKLWNGRIIQLCQKCLAKHEGKIKKRELKEDDRRQAISQTSSVLER